ncbi:hypothetical protein FQN53_007240 [Emmonsiellopsis sp. PD_33]|nr:hypothetical protein FQN53_007240 [Emmonsiellopsis sp. PD_33]
MFYSKHIRCRVRFHQMLVRTPFQVGSNTHKVDNAFASEEWVGPEFPLTPRAPLPNTRDNLPTKYSDPILQMTPLGFVETSADDPLRLYKDGPVYTMTIRFPATKIQSRGDNPFVRINRKVIKVIIDGESNSGGVGADNDDGGNDSRDAPDPFSRGSKVGLQAGPEEGSKETARSMVENFKGLTVAEERSGS